MQGNSQLGLEREPWWGRQCGAQAVGAPREPLLSHGCLADKGPTSVPSPQAARQVWAGVGSAPCPAGWKGQAHCPLAIPLVNPLSLFLSTTCFPSCWVPGKRRSRCVGCASVEPSAHCYPVSPHAVLAACTALCSPGMARLLTASAGLQERPPCPPDCVLHAAGLGAGRQLWDVPSLPGSPLQPGSPPLSVPFPPPVDQSMFENASASTAPTPRSQHVPAAPGSLLPSRPAGSQHLRNLGKAVGAKVNDLLRRKEPAGLPSVGVMEVNASAGAMLVTGLPASEDG